MCDKGFEANLARTRCLGGLHTPNVTFHTSYLLRIQNLILAVKFIFPKSFIYKIFEYT